MIRMSASSMRRSFQAGFRVFLPGSPASRPTTHRSRRNAVGCSFVPQDFHPLPPHQLAWRSKCHVLSCEGRAMSCFVMFCMRTAHSLQSFRAWSRRFGPPLLTFHRGSPSFRFRHGSLLSARLHSVLPAARLPGAAGPCLAHNARRRLRARPRAFRGGAYRAPDRPGAPARASRTQGAPRPSAESGAFPRRRRRRRKRPPDASSQVCS